MKIGSLFSGIGGLDLGLEKGLAKYGAETVWQVEQDEHCVNVLKKHWPNAKQILDDVNNVDFTELEQVDMLIGGFPCQTFSVAGTRKGMSEQDERGILWYQYERAISEIRPKWVVAENVRGLLTAKDDQGRKGGAFARVVSFLASRGYRVEWQIVSAGTVNAPHLRERIFIVAKQEEVEYPGSKSDGNNDKQTNAISESRNTRFDNNTRRGGTQSRHDWQEIEQQMGRISYGICPGLAGNLGLPNYWDYFADRVNWATPTTQDTPHSDMELTESGRRLSKDGKSSHSLNLQDQVNLSEKTKWPTPTARDWKDTKGSKNKANRKTLPLTVLGKTTWSTPLASQGHRGDSPAEWKRHTHILSVQQHYKEYEPWETEPRAVDDYPLRRQKLMALGNAVVPACAEFVGLCIARAIEKNTIVFDQNIKDEPSSNN